jgi:hypothetical protein
VLRAFVGLCDGSAHGDEDSTVRAVRDFVADVARMHRHHGPPTGGDAVYRVLMFNATEQQMDLSASLGPWVRFVSQAVSGAVSGTAWEEGIGRELRAYANELFSTVVAGLDTEAALYGRPDEGLAIVPDAAGLCAHLPPQFMGPKAGGVEVALAHGLGGFSLSATPKKRLAARLQKRCADILLQMCLPGEALACVDKALRGLRASGDHLFMGLAEETRAAALLLRASLSDRGGSRVRVWEPAFDSQVVAALREAVGHFDAVVATPELATLADAITQLPLLARLRLCSTWQVRRRAKRCRHSPRASAWRRQKSCRSGLVACGCVLAPSTHSCARVAPASLRRRVLATRLRLLLHRKQGGLATGMPRVGSPLAAIDLRMSTPRWGWHPTVHLGLLLRIALRLRCLGRRPLLPCPLLPPVLACHPNPRLALRLSRQTQPRCAASRCLRPPILTRAGTTGTPLQRARRGGWRAWPSPPLREGDPMRAADMGRERLASTAACLRVSWPPRRPWGCSEWAAQARAAAPRTLRRQGRALRLGEARQGLVQARWWQMAAAGATRPPRVSSRSQSCWGSAWASAGR